MLRENAQILLWRCMSTHSCFLFTSRDFLTRALLEPLSGGVAHEAATRTGFFVESASFTLFPMHDNAVRPVVILDM